MKDKREKKNRKKKKVKKYKKGGRGSSANAMRALLSAADVRNDVRNHGQWALLTCHGLIELFFGVGEDNISFLPAIENSSAIGEEVGDGKRTFLGRRCFFVRYGRFVVWSQASSTTCVSSLVGVIKKKDVGGLKRRCRQERD